MDNDMFLKMDELIKQVKKLNEQTASIHEWSVEYLSNRDRNQDKNRSLGDSQAYTNLIMDRQHNIAMVADYMSWRVSNGDEKAAGFLALLMHMLYYLRDIAENKEKWLIDG